MSAIYKAKVVTELQKWYGTLLTNMTQFNTIADHLSALSERLFEGVQQNNAVVFSEINNYNPNYLGVDVDILQAKNLGIADCQLTIACEHGYADWAHLEAGAQTAYNSQFESAVNLLLEGNLNELRNMIAAYPELVSEKSNYPHGATLLHYAASNGVEFWRQQVPYNLKEIVQFLLDQGANPKVTMAVYGGHFDVLSLFTSSAHPYEAGIGKEVELVLSF